MFLNAATNEGEQVTVNYTSNSEVFLNYLIQGKDSFPESLGSVNLVKGKLIE